VGNPYVLTGGQFTVDRHTQAYRWCEAEKAAGRTTHERWAILQNVALVPQARWIGPADPKPQLQSLLADVDAAGTLPVLVSYAIPQRDLGGASRGGFTSASAFQEYAASFAQVIGDRPAVVILEPDSLMHLSDMTSALQAERLRCLNHAVRSFALHAPNTWVYLDGGDGRYNSPEKMAPALAQAGVIAARGFAVNVSNFNATTPCIDFAVRLRTLLTTKHGVHSTNFVIDTSRNGNGAPSDTYINSHPGDWMLNPPGRKLGERPQAKDTGYGWDAAIWGKRPGESDGPGGLSQAESGMFVPDLAYSLYVGR
jgi:endoglucanase